MSALLQEVLVEQLRDLLHAEGQLVKALPKMARAAKSPQLKTGFQNHLAETQGQVERLKQVFELLGEKAKAKPCRAMQGLIEEGQETIAEGKEMENVAADLALAVSAQKIEHYEIAGYGSVRTLAEALGNQKIVKLLAQTLAEEEKQDKLITDGCVPLIEEAGQELEEEEEEE
jgi:Mn-containing catalase